MKKAYLKRWSSNVVKVRGSVNKQNLNDYHRHLEREDSDWLKFFNATTLPRVAVLEAMRKSIQQASIVRNITLFKRASRIHVLFYTSDAKQWWFVYRIGNCFKRSIPYSSRDNALRQYTANNIGWQHISIISGE